MNLNDIYPLNDLKRSKTAKLRYVYPPKLLCRVEAHQKVRGIVLAATSARNFSAGKCTSEASAVSGFSPITERKNLEGTAMGTTVVSLNQQILIHCGICQAVDNVIHIFRTSCVKTV